MATKFWIADALSCQPLRGSPAAVFFVENLARESVLQSIAMEINTPETIFVKKTGNSNFESACYSPNAKGMILGSGLFAAAKVINSENRKLREFAISIGTKEYAVSINGAGQIRIRFATSTIRRAVVPTNLFAAVNGELVVSVKKCRSDLIVELRHPEKLAKLAVDVGILQDIDYESFIMTADTRDEPKMDCDFCAKTYMPRTGIFKNVVSPIAHVKLAAYWAKRIGCSTSAHFKSMVNDGNFATLDIEENFTFITGDCSVSAEGNMYI